MLEGLANTDTGKKLLDTLLGADVKDVVVETK